MQTKTRKLAGGAIGNIGEQFDFSLFALTAPTLAANFFPESNHLAALLSTFAVYALAFVARPLGGVLFGYVGDRFGRIAVLTWTVVLMGIGTMLVGLLPTYQSIGVLAPILLVVCRLLQGLSLGRRDDERPVLHRRVRTRREARCLDDACDLVRLLAGGHPRPADLRSARRHGRCQLRQLGLADSRS